MLKKTLVCSWFLVLSACPLPAPPPPPPPPAPPTCPTPLATCVEVATAPSMIAACPDDRFVGVRAPTDPTCPSASQATGGTWVASLLFDPSDNTTAGAQLPPGLKPYCLYTWRPTQGTTQGGKPVTTALPVGMSGLAQDCRVVVPMGSRMTDLTWERLHGAFLKQVDALGSLPDGLTPVQPVRVAVVDTSPDGYADGRPLPGRSGHGMAVGTIVRELGCPDPAYAAAPPAAGESCVDLCGGSSPSGRCWCDAACDAMGDCCADKRLACDGPAGVCIAHTSMHLALPHVTADKVDEVGGGYFGTQAELAMAIDRAIDVWLKDRVLMPNLVINLSVGWEPRYGGRIQQSPDELSGPVRGVYAALLRASCLGALVMAAAGNRPGGPEPAQGPVLPALWETQPAPTFEQCRVFAGTEFNPNARHFFLDAKVPQPLLHSAGGLTGHDHPLSIGRVLGRPRLAAPASHAVGARYDLGPLPEPTSVLTGTSVAAAAVSGIASTLWGYRASLAGAEIIELIHQSSVGLATPADYCVGGQPCPWAAGDPQREIRRAGLCEALRLACASPVESCPTAAALPACSGRPAFGDGRASLTPADALALDALGPRVVDAGAVSTSLPALAVCEGPGYWNDAAVYPVRPCPARQYYGPPVAPWVLSQPSSPPCPSCGIGVMRASIASSGGIGADAGAGTATLYLEIDDQYLSSLTSATLLLPGVGELSLAGVGTLSATNLVKVVNLPLPALGGPGPILSFAVLGAGGGVVGSVEQVLLESW